MGKELGNARDILASGASAGELLDFDLLADDQLDEEPELAAEGPDAQANLYGNIYTVPRGTTQSDPQPGPFVPREPRERLWTITIQPITIPLSTGVAVIPVPLVAVATYGQGQATFTKVVKMTATTAVKFTVVARRVEISFYQGIAGQWSGGSATVSASIVPGAYTGADGYAWTWADNGSGGAPISGADNGLAWTGAGVLGQIHVMVSAVANPGTALWPLLLDLAAAPPPANSLPIRGGRLDAVFGVGDGQQFSDERAPGATSWTNGLVVALSTRPDIYVAPNAGNQMTVDVKAGT